MSKISKDKLEYNKKCILEVIQNYIIRKNYPPSIREIQQELKTITSTSTVHKYLKILEEEGKIKIDKNISRGIRFLK